MPDEEDLSVLNKLAREKFARIKEKQLGADFGKLKGEGKFVDREHINKLEEEKRKKLEELFDKSRDDKSKANEIEVKELNPEEEFSDQAVGSAIMLALDLLEIDNKRKIAIGYIITGTRESLEKAIAILQGEL